MFGIPLGDSTLFEYVFKLVFGSNNVAESVVPLFPRDLVLPSDAVAALCDVCYPADFHGSPQWQSDIFVTSITSSSILFVYVWPFIEDSAPAAYCLVTKYLHRQFMTFLLKDFFTNKERAILQCEQFHRIVVRQSKYNWYIDENPKFSVPFASDLAPHCELAQAYSSLLCLLPPYLIGSLLLGLFSNLRIVAVSSSLSRLSTVLLGLSQLLFPFQGICFHFPVKILSANVLKTIRISEPAIFGLHSSLIGEVKELDPEVNGVLNVDLPYLRYPKFDNIPAKFRDAIGTFHTNISNAVVQRAPTFPGDRVHREARKLIVAFLGPCLGGSAEFDQFTEFLSNAQKGYEDLEPFESAIATGTLSREFFRILASRTPESDTMRKAYFPGQAAESDSGIVPFPPPSLAPAPPPVQERAVPKHRRTLGSRTRSATVDPKLLEFK
jgi:hypothetical protein